ncbi:MAG: hypothetical protein V2B18_25395 [Pseudomonadota bacterium]
MSDTIVDMPKVTQMLDAGWEVTIFRPSEGMRSYICMGRHHNGRVRDALREKLRAAFTPSKDLPEYEEEWDWTDNERTVTDDFTPEQALTRLAYKVQGEILW